MKQAQDDVKKVDRRMMGVAAGTFALALLIWGGFSRQQRQAVQSAPAKSQSGPRMVAESTEEKAQFIEHAKMLREKWRPWALAHQAPLKRMLNASPNDQAAMLVVWDAVPSNPDTLGMPDKVRMPSGNPFVGVGFGWRAFDKGLATAPPPPRAEDAAMIRRIAGMLPEKLRHEFQTRRDIVISVGGRYTDTQLWASGRITQRDWRTPAEYAQAALQARREGRRMTPEDYWQPAREEVPPYDFLTR